MVIHSWRFDASEIASSRTQCYTYVGLFLFLGRRLLFLGVFPQVSWQYLTNSPSSIYTDSESEMTGLCELRNYCNGRDDVMMLARILQSCWASILPPPTIRPSFMCWHYQYFILRLYLIKLETKKMKYQIFDEHHDTVRRLQSSSSS